MTLLKPCPFCGSDRVSLARAGNRSHINCSVCHADGPAVWGKADRPPPGMRLQPLTPEDTADIIKAWNERIL